MGIFQCLDWVRQNKYARRGGADDVERIAGEKDQAVPVADVAENLFGLRGVDDEGVGDSVGLLRSVTMFQADLVAEVYIFQSPEMGVAMREDEGVI